MTRARELARLANENVFTAEDYNSPVEVGINSTSPSSTLDVRGELKVGTAIQAGTAGVVTATEFSGSIGTFSGAGSFGGNLDVTGNVTIGGTLTYEDVTNIDVVGLITARSGVNVSGGQLLVGSGVTIGNAGVTTFSGTSDIHLHDNVKLLVGDSSDLQIYNDGTNNYIKHVTTGAVYFDTTTNLNFRVNSSETAILATANEGVEIRYNDSKKWETTNDGTVTTGVATVTGASTIGGILDVTGTLRVNTNKFIAESATGNITVAGTSAFASKATVNATLQCNEGLLVNVGITTVNGISQLLETILIQTTTTYPATNGNTHGGAYFEKGGSSTGTSFFVARTDNVPLYVGRNDTGSYIQLSKSGVAEGSINLRGDDRLALATSAEAVLEVNNSGVRLGITTNNTVMVGSDTNSTKLMTIRETNNATTGGTGGGSYYNLLIGGNTHLTGRGYGIGFDPEAYAERVKIGILCEGNSTGYSRGNLHIVMNNDGDSTEATISDSVMSFLPAGKVGINSTVPTLPLDVFGEGIGINRNAGDPYIALKTNGTTHTMAYGGVSTGFRVFTHPAGGSLTERLRIAPDGHVRIGAGDPVYELELIGSGAQHLLVGSTDSSGAVLVLDGDSNGDGSGSDYVTIKHDTSGNLDISNRKTASIIFKTGSSEDERARITSTGEWMVATTSSSPDTASTVNGMTYSSSKLRVARSGDACSAFNRNSTTGDIMQLNYNGTQRGSIQTDGTVIAFNTGSDYRLKENEVALTDGITKVKQLKPYTFNFKDSPNKIDQGFFAHEVQPVVPGAVSGTKDAVHSEDKDSDGIKAGDIDAQQMDYAKLTPLLTAALQEAIAEIETLKADVAALKSS